MLSSEAVEVSFFLPVEAILLKLLGACWATSLPFLAKSTHNSCKDFQMPLPHRRSKQAQGVIVKKGSGRHSLNPLTPTYQIASKTHQKDLTEPTGLNGRAVTQVLHLFEIGVPNCNPKDRTVCFHTPYCLYAFSKSYVSPQSLPLQNPPLS